MTQFFFLLVAILQSMRRICGPHLRIIAPVGNTDLFEEMLQRYWAVGNTESSLIGPRFEPQTSLSKTNALLLDQLNLEVFSELSDLIVCRYTGEITKAKSVAVKSGFFTGFGYGLFDIALFGIMAIGLWFGSKLVIEEEITVTEFFGFFSVLISTFSLGTVSV